MKKLDSFKISNADLFFKGTIILAAIRLTDEYANGQKTGKQLVSVDVVSQFTQFEKQTVKCTEMIALPIEQDKLDELNASGHFVHVKFEGFNAELWQDFRNNNEIKVRATAKNSFRSIYLMRKTVQNNERKTEKIA